MCGAANQNYTPRKMKLMSAAFGGKFECSSSSSSELYDICHKICSYLIYEGNWLTRLVWLQNFCHYALLHSVFNCLKLMCRF
ncbi:unnamed protein product [Callosobruchus maculatus]|uniref:Uncharacterized protein n=1 Tax=Callosobruchus maculatus TaxID=64391 RepID=A0A653DI19_CALMS|nr:unnamed protein product [Callosobruchus maculatus]